MFLYSGLEFVLSFLISIKFGYTNVQQIYIYGGIGITKALIQGILVGNIRFELIQNYISWVSNSIFEFEKQNRKFSVINYLTW